MMLAAQQRAAARPVKCNRSHAFAANVPAHRAQHAKLRAAPQAVTASSVPAPPAELLQEVQKLMKLRTTEGTSKEELTAQLAVVEKMSKEAGTDKVFQSINNGRFRARTVEGVIAELGKGPISFARLSFGQYKPLDTQVLAIAQDFVELTKGPYDEYEQGYVAHAAFKLIDTGVEGVSSAIAVYSEEPGNPQRLNIEFKSMVLEPVVKQPGDLEKWLEALKPHNPDMGDDGVLKVQLPPHKGTLDHILMTEKYHLVRGNFGSVTLLEREDA